MTGDGRLRSDWNRAVLEDVVAPAYCSLLQFLSTYNLVRATSVQSTDVSGTIDLATYYSLWPTAGSGEPWSALIQRVYRLANDQPLLYCTDPVSSGGSWV